MGLLKKQNDGNLIWDGPDLRCRSAISKATCIRPVPISKGIFAFSTALICRHQYEPVCSLLSFFKNAIFIIG
jgi:hypothetical protein